MTADEHDPGIRRSASADAAALRLSEKEPETVPEPPPEPPKATGVDPAAPDGTQPRRSASAEAAALRLEEQPDD